MRPLRILPQSLLSAAAAQEGLVSKAQCDAAGINKDAVALLIRQGRWRRVARGVYDTDPEPVERRRREDFHGHVRRRAAWLGMLAVPDGIATGACALALLGVDGLPLDLVPEAARPGGMYAAVGAGVVLRRYRFSPTSPTEGGGSHQSYRRWHRPFPSYRATRRSECSARLCGTGTSTRLGSRTCVCWYGGGAVSHGCTAR